jgi:hypothetical protein
MSRSALRRSAALAAAPALLASLASAQVQVDLNDWNDESYAAVSGFGAGVWSVAPDGSTVTQSVNGQPTLFYSDFNVFNTEVEGKIVSGGGDDDFIGFVLGFQPGDTTAAGADYLLVDWKAGTQTFDFGDPSCTAGSNALAGLAVSRVTGIPTADEFWGHVNFDAACSDLGSGLQELARGTTLGATGWTAGKTYTFKFVFDATSLQVFVDGALELDIAGSFADGRMGFYNFSQAGVTYSAFTLGCPTLVENYGAGWPGTLGVPTLTASGPAILGTTIQIQVGNASGVDTYGCLFVGHQPSALPTPYGGTLLVDPTATASLHPLPVGGATIDWKIPQDITWCGMDAYAQLVHDDVAATHGIAFSQGLHVIVGQ